MTTAKTVPTKSVGTESIRRKINRTRRSVKLAELVAGILLFAAGSLLFLLTLAVIDHWIVGLNFAARLLAFLVYVVAAVGFLWIYVAPLLFHSINPLYAAKMIEQGQPTLKNSLLNFMFLSQNNQGTHKAVLDAVENQAATDISSLSLEHLVDYSKAIRIGYVLATLAILFGLYTVLSPKNPLQTAARIAMPWNDIARPSRVKIVDVQPGDASIYQGQEIEVIVKLYDVSEGDRLEVIYSTKDGQLVDQAIPLQVSADGFDYRAMLSTSDSGIQQDLTYRIEAGDASTRDYEVTTLEAPSIDVASLRYDFPAYTQEASWEQQGDGHIRALEGTMVTIHAVSNRPIKKAYIEFDPVADSPIVSLNTIPLQVSSEEPTKASVRFPLEMNDAGTAGKFRSYQIRFRTDDNVLNPHPVLYHIDVVRDLPPEIEYLEPTASEVELPINRSLDVRLRAIDPDFGIRQLRVTGTISQEAGPRLEKTIDASILDQPKSGQVIESWKLVPKEHKLEVGDVVKLIGVAEDTRTDFAGNLNPNIARTNPRTIRIIEPVAGDQQGKSDEEGANDDQGKQSDEMNESNDSGEQGDQQGQGSESGESGDMSEGEKGDEENQSEGNSGGDSNQDGMKGQSDKPQEGENNGESEDQQSGQGSGSSSKKEQGDENQEPQQGKGSQPQEGEQQSGEPQEGDPEPGEGGMGQSQQEGGDQKSQSQSSGGKGGEASDASDMQQREQNQSDQQGQPNGSGTGKAGDPNKGGELQQGDASTQPNENSTVERQQDPVASDGSQDGDAFERIQEYLNEKQKQQGQQPPSDESGKPNPQQQGTGEGSNTGQKPEDGMQDGAGGDSQKNPADSQGEKSEGQNKQGQGSKQGANEQSTGEKEGSQQNEGGADNGRKPENSTGGENATGEQKQEGEPGSNDQNNGQSSERDTQNYEQGASENKGGATQEDKEANPSNDSERSGDTGKGDNTNSGAGSKSNEGDQGSPESSEKANKQGENNMKPDDRSSDEQGDQPKSPSNSDKQSDSKGETRGDQSGGGGSGGGQSAKQAGNDSAGSTSAADEGAGAANQQGEGETGNEGGEGPQADQQTGSSGEQQGEGSSKTNSPAGQESGMQGAESEKGPSDSQQSNDPQQSGQGPGNSAIPQGGGLEGNNAPQNNDGPRVEPGEDAANLEYAKKATDMVLDELNHQDSPDQQMLDDLGWTKDDFARFVQRWKQMKQAAGSDDTQAKQDLNDALRSLGLSRGEDTTRRVESREAAAGGSSDTQRGSPPPSFMEQYRAYLKGASQ